MKKDGSDRARHEPEPLQPVLAHLRSHCLPLRLAVSGSLLATFLAPPTTLSPLITHPPAPEPSPPALTATSCNSATWAMCFGVGWGFLLSFSLALYSGAPHKRHFLGLLSALKRKLLSFTKTQNPRCFFNR